MIGKIISLVLIGLTLIFILVFFTQKKSPILMAIYTFEILLLATMQLLAWYVDTAFSFAVTIMSIVCIVSGIIVVLVYQSYFKNIFIKLSKISGRFSLFL